MRPSLLSCGRCQAIVREAHGRCPACGVDQPTGGWHDDPFLGRVVAGRYRLDERVGVGGFGLVFRAMQIDGEDEIGEVAVKLLRPDRLTLPDAKRRFLDEARSARRIKSPHAIKVYDAGMAEDNTPFTVMELLSDRTVSHLIRELKQVPVRRALRIVDQVAAAMAESHVAGVIHRDLKPGNLSLGKDDFVKVIDFGIARTNVDPTATFTAIGSPSYIAPEQAAGEPVDGRADIYSLGVILIEMLTGRRIVAPGLVPDGVPDALVRFCESMIAIYPDDRPETMEDVRSTVAELMGATFEGRPTADVVTGDEPATGRRRLETEPVTRGEPHRQRPEVVTQAAKPGSLAEATMSEATMPEAPETALLYTTRGQNLRRPVGLVYLIAAAAAGLVLSSGLFWVMSGGDSAGTPPAASSLPPAEDVVGSEEVEIGDAADATGDAAGNATGNATGDAADATGNADEQSETVAETVDRNATVSGDEVEPSELTNAAASGRLVNRGTNARRGQGVRNDSAAQGAASPADQGSTSQGSTSQGSTGQGSTGQGSTGQGSSATGTSTAPPSTPRPRPQHRGWGPAPQIF